MDDLLEKKPRITLADLLDHSAGKMMKICLGDNSYIQGTLAEVQEDYLLIRREPMTYVPLDKIIWFQFLE
ncbi:hypothetical protein ACFL27_09840 [candidate division CSSED10-310 bacterium]|uniref:DUF2642 domain-containing protein n=1 Tax=candidate division CSSED10-310 bacterium TaxID=2855610 RepID=A0ABV6YWA0_UNCC1